MNISDLDFGLRTRTRALQALAWAEVRTVDELIAYSRRDLLALPCVGKATASAIERALVKAGLSLRADCGPDQAVRCEQCGCWKMTREYCS